jgi:hypothetical protein
VAPLATVEGLDVVEDGVRALAARASACDRGARSAQDQKDFMIALTNASPTDPNDGMSPVSRTRSVKAPDVN